MQLNIQMSHNGYTSVFAFAFCVLAGGCTQETISAQPQNEPEALANAFELHVDRQGNVSLPDNFVMDWTHLGSWAVAADGGVEGLHSVYAPKSEVEYYRANGRFADGATMIKEVRKARGAAHTTGDAHWAEGVQVWFVMVKDTEGRFKDNPLWGDGWGWALFNGDDPAKQVATDYKKDCLGCHIPAKESDWTYVYGYPILGSTVAQYIPEEEVAASAAAVAMTSMATASGDTMEGKKVFARCASCHSLTPGQHGVGPSLAGISGRKAGSADGYNYSPALRDSDIVWTAETLDAHLSDVRGFIPGNRMGNLFPAGVQDEEERANVIAYLIDAETP